MTLLQRKFLIPAGKSLVGPSSSASALIAAGGRRPSRAVQGWNAEARLRRGAEHPLRNACGSRSLGKASRPSRGYAKSTF